MQFKHFILFLFFITPIIARATDIPIMGDEKADSHQLCGDKIDVEIQVLNDTTIVLGLVNNKTKNIDLFMSNGPSPDQASFSKFSPVKFDSLSKSYVPIDDKDIDIVWGGSVDENKKTSYSLALGPEVYTCTAPQKWPNEKANELYGEIK
jgi:hypothetical protein